ncbi:MAG: glycosyltransferase family 4 protein, partial [Candidatus Omnitrophica bacterium]|nr:glycosyltransferase family 4 protein [Candidatus Omnitrophota bacterium]
MNILIITNHLNIGGITSYCLTLAAGLRKKGHKVYFASSGGNALERFLQAGIEFVAIPMKTKKEINPRILFCAGILSKLVKEKDIQIVHTHSRTTQVLGAILARRTKATHIFTCHGFFKPRFLRRMFPCWGTKIIAISEQVKRHLVDDFKVDEQKIQVIHNGIDIDKFKDQGSNIKNISKTKLGLGDGPVVGIIARLSDVKGHAYLIKAMKKVLERLPRAQLLIAGEGKEKEALVSLAKNLAIEKNVFFITEALDTRELLGVMDLFVMPSIKEGLGLALMEAMAFGVPVIGSDVGGIKTLIRDGVSGLLVAVANSDGLANAIISLLGDPVKAQGYAKEARRFISENFS